MVTYITNDLLFEDIKEGDEHAFKILFLRYYGKLSKTCYSIVQRWEIAEEIAVDILHTLFIKAQEIVITEGLEQYLHRSAQNAALNYIRNEGRRKMAITFIPEYSAELAEEDSSFNRILGKQDDLLLETLETLLSKLPDESRQVMMLKKEGMTYKAIAEYLNLPEKKVRNLIDRTIRKLRIQFRDIQVDGLYTFLFFLLFYNIVLENIPL